MPPATCPLLLSVVDASGSRTKANPQTAADPNTLICSTSQVCDGERERVFL